MRDEAVKVYFKVTDEHQPQINAYAAGGVRREIGGMGMANFCGRCGRKLDEQTGQCPVCGTAYRYIEEPLRQELAQRPEMPRKVKKEKEPKKNHKCKAIFLICMLTSIVCICVIVFAHFPINRVPMVENIVTEIESMFSRGEDNILLEIYEECGKEYSLLENSADEGYTLSVIAPDVTVLIEYDEAQWRTCIEEGSIPEKEYVFQTNSVDETEISAAFLDKVAYDLMVHAIVSTKKPSLE